MDINELKKMLQNPMSADWSKLKAEDIRFNMGTPMTEEQMKEYCQKNGIKPTIMKNKEKK